MKDLRIYALGTQYKDTSTHKISSSPTKCTTFNTALALKSSSFIFFLIIIFIFYFGWNHGEKIILAAG